MKLPPLQPPQQPQLLQQFQSQVPPLYLVMILAIFGLGFVDFAAGFGGAETNCEGMLRLGLEALLKLGSLLYQNWDSSSTTLTMLVNIKLSFCVNKYIISNHTLL